MSVKSLILIAAMLALPFAACAESMDATQVKLDDGCSVQEYVRNRIDFDEQWGHGRGAAVLAVTGAAA